MKSILNKKNLWFLIWGIVAIYIVCFFIAKPRIANDSAGGFLAMLTWQNGGDWNTTCSLINNNVNCGFQAWWAPGQYMIPWLFIKALRLDIGHAIVVSQILCMILLVFGYRRLMRKFGFDDTVIYISMIIILIGRGFNNNAINFSADNYLLCYTVYFMLVCINAGNRASIINMLVLFGISICGLYIKNSFVIVLLCLILYRIISLKEYTRKALTSFFIFTVVPIACAVLVFYKIYVHAGYSIDDSGGLDLSVNNLLNTFLKPGTAALFAPFSLNTILAKVSDLFSMSATAQEDWSSIEIIIAAAVAILSAIWITKRPLHTIKHIKTRPYNTLAFAFFAGFCIFYFYAVLFNKSISTEDRLFLPLSAVLTPYFVSLSVKRKSILIVLILTSFYSITAYFNDCKRNLGIERTILHSGVAIDGHLDGPQPNDTSTGIAYISMPEYSLILPRKKHIIISQGQTDSLLKDSRNTVIYAIKGHIKLQDAE